MAKRIYHELPNQLTLSTKHISEFVFNECIWHFKTLINVAQCTVCFRHISWSHGSWILTFWMPISTKTNSPATERVFHILISNIIIANKWDISPINLKIFILYEYLQVTGLYAVFTRFNNYGECDVARIALWVILSKPIPIYKLPGVTYFYITDCILMNYFTIWNSPRKSVHIQIIIDENIFIAYAWIQCC